jgi:hypothetical protein
MYKLCWSRTASRMRRPKCCSMPSTVVTKSARRLGCCAPPYLYGRSHGTQPSPAQFGRLTLMVGPRSSGSTLHHQSSHAHTLNTSLSPTPYTPRPNTSITNPSPIPAPPNSTTHNSLSPQLTSSHPQTRNLRHSLIHLHPHQSHPRPSTPSHVCSRSRVRALGPPARRSWG